MYMLISIFKRLEMLLIIFYLFPIVLMFYVLY
jgi:hypothetical protein